MYIYVTCNYRSRATIKRTIMIANVMLVDICNYSLRKQCLILQLISKRNILFINLNLCVLLWRRVSTNFEGFFKVSRMSGHARFWSEKFNGAYAACDEVILLFSLLATKPRFHFDSKYNGGAKKKKWEKKAKTAMFARTILFYISNQQLYRQFYARTRVT